MDARRWKAAKSAAGMGGGGAMSWIFGHKGVGVGAAYLGLFPSLFQMKPAAARRLNVKGTMLRIEPFALLVQISAM